MDNLSCISFCRSSICNLDEFPRLENEKTDCGRFQRALDNTPSGGVLLIPPGKYVADSIEITQEIQVIGQGEVEIVSTAPNRDIFVVLGAFSDTKFILEKHAMRGDREITLATSPEENQLKPGDMIVLTEESANKPQDVSRNIEVHEIDSIDGKTIVFRDTVYLPKNPAEVNLYRVYPLNNVRIENICVQLKEGSNCGRGLYANGVRNLTVQGFHGKRMAGSLVQIRKAMHVIVEKFSNDSPQKVGSGQGYGVQFYGGASYITIRDGLTQYCRHSIDLEGTYNACVENVVDMEGLGANFVLVHNGWGTDITFRNCRAVNSRSTGFVVESQGYSDAPDKNPYKNSHKYQLYNFSILDCEVHHKQGYGDFSSGIFFTVPVLGTIVRGCRILHGSGRAPVAKTYGIRMWPCNNHITVQDCSIEGYSRGLCLWVNDIPSRNDSSANKITFQNLVIRNCDSMALMNSGDLRCVHFKDIKGDGLQSAVFEILSSGSFYELVLEGVSIVNSPSASMFTAMPQGHGGQCIRGIISNIQTDRPCELTLASGLLKGGTIPMDTFYLNRVGNSLCLSGEGSISSFKGEVLPDGVLQGQRVTLIATSRSSCWIIHQGKNILFSNNAESISLGRDRYAVTLEWRKDGVRGYWYEIA